MSTSHKSYVASSSLVAHTVLLLELKRVVLLGEESKGTQRQPEPSTHVRVRRHSWRKLFFLGLLLVASGWSAHAQSTFGSIRGTVQDDSGAVIPGATVAVRSLDQATSRQTI